MSRFVAELTRRAEAHPERAWLFFPFGAHWRWWSWGQAAERLATLAEPAGSRRPFEDPDALLHWLRDADRHLAEPAFHLADNLLHPALADRARPGTRDIWVAGNLDLPVHRALLAWALTEDAVVALPWRDGKTPGDDAGSTPFPRVVTAAWLRATVFSGDGAEIGRLRETVAAERRPVLASWWRALDPSWRDAWHLPWGRLHTVVAAGAEEPGVDAENDEWEARGVRLLQPD